jgi:hypothetical protein
MMREFFDDLTAREQRVLGWSAVAVAAALWLATAWTDPWLLLGVPLAGAAFAAFVARNRRVSVSDSADDDDWF